MGSLLSKRFAELVDQMGEVEATKHQRRSPVTGHPHESLDDAKLLGWRVKAKSLLEKACGPDSQHLRQFVDAESASFLTSPNIASNLKAIFLAAQEDFDGGYLASAQSLAQAEVFDSELEQARELLNGRYFAAAAVIAGAVLETTLRQLCGRYGVDIAKLDKVNADLVKAGAYNKVRQQQITALYAIRTAAAHGDNAAFNAEDVRGMVNDVERFVAEYLGP